jgi:hypothetical protein
MSSDWLPKKEAELVKLMRTWDTALASSANRTAFGWDPTKCANVQAAMDKYITAVDDYTKDDSSKNALAKEDERTTSIAAMRAFAASDIRVNDKMADTDKLAMGVRLPKKRSRARKPKPKDLVAFRFKTVPGAHRVIVEFWIEGMEGVSKGKGEYHAAEVLYCVRAVNDPPPKDVNEEGWHSVADTASPWAKTFNAADAGKVLYVTMRWENYSTGEDDEGKGQWCDIRSVIIP